MNTARSFVVFAIAASFAATAAPVMVHAETTAPAAAHVRLWKTDLHELTQVRVSLKTVEGKHATEHDLGNAGPGYLFNNYADATAGHGTLKVYTGTETTPVLSQSVDFAPGAYLTVLLSEPEKLGSPPRLEVIEDKKAARHTQLIVRSFVENLKEMQIKVGESLNAQFVAEDSFLQMRGLKAAIYSIHTTGARLDDKPFDWTNEADLRQHSYQTLLVYPDPYGRIRPRLIVDCESQTNSQDDQENKR